MVFVAQVQFCSQLEGKVCKILYHYVGYRVSTVFWHWHRLSWNIQFEFHLEQKNSKPQILTAEYLDQLFVIFSSKSVQYNVDTV